MSPTATLLLYAYALSSHLFFLGFLSWFVFVLGPNLLLNYPSVAWRSLVAMGRAVQDGDVLAMLNELMRLCLSTAILVVVFSLVARLRGSLFKRPVSGFGSAGGSPRRR
jgi:hypothetical protein